MNQIDDTQPGAGRLVAIGRSDAALRRADLVFAFENLALFVELAVIGQYQMRCLTQKQVAVHVDLQLAQAFDFFDETDRIDDDSIADDAFLALAQNAGRNQVQDVFLLAQENRVAGVVAALSADYNVRVFRQHVDDFAFALVTPLGADQDSIRHRISSRVGNKNPRSANSGRRAQLFAAGK